jgi:hypothetical protein
MKSGLSTGKRYIAHFNRNLDNNVSVHQSKRLVGNALELLNKSSPTNAPAIGRHPLLYPILSILDQIPHKARRKSTFSQSQEKRKGTTGKEATS